MGLFTPKLPPGELSRIQSRLAQCQECANLVNTTTNPEVFFKRLNMTLDILMELRTYEKYKIFKGSKPSSEFNKIIRNIEATVNDFIDRAIEANQQKLAALKTESARKNNHKKFAIGLKSAFDCANTFWSGSFSQTRVIPHYTGPLFTKNNYRRVQDLFNALGDQDCPSKTP